MKSVKKQSPQWYWNYQKSPLP